MTRPFNGSPARPMTLSTPELEKELRALALAGHGQLVYNTLRLNPGILPPLFCDGYIFLEAVRGGIGVIQRLHQEAAELPKKEELNYLGGLIDVGLEAAQREQALRKQHFMAVLEWADQLIELGLLELASSRLQALQVLGVGRFHDLSLRTQISLSLLDSLCGRFEEAYQRLIPLLEKPYLLGDRKVLPRFFQTLSTAALKSGRLAYYKEMLFQALRNFYTELEARQAFTEQLCTIYRRGWRVLFASEVAPAFRLLFLVHWLFFRWRKLPLFGRLPGLGGVRSVLLLYVYIMNGFLPQLFPRRALKRASFEWLNASAPTLPVPALPVNSPFRLRRKHVLITRVMGGIGDLLMLTPALHALKKRYPGQEIHLAIPRRYFALFEDNPDVVLLDIERDPVNPFLYKRWFNFTDCPAAQGEALRAPKVRKSRIDLFARALGIRGWRYWWMNRQPRYTIRPAEAREAEQFWRQHHLESKQVVGIQLHADELYRDYPYMEPLALKLAQHYPVLVFNAHPIEGFDHPWIFKIQNRSLRQAFALAARCQLLIAPDSAFVHFSAAMNIPCLGIYGPIDGKVRTRQYRNCQFVDLRRQLGCIPCWRNEDIPCKLTGLRTSACLENLPVHLVYQKVLKMLEKIEKCHGLSQRI